MLSCLFSLHRSVNRVPKHMLRTISLYDDGTKPPGHFLICILLLNKRTRTEGRLTQRGIPCFLLWFLNRKCAHEKEGKGHILTYIQLNNNIWRHGDISNGREVCCWGITSHGWLTALRVAARKRCLPRMLKNTLLFLQVQNRKRFSTSSSLGSFLFAWRERARPDSLSSSMNEADSHPDQLQDNRSNNPPRWPLPHSL